MNPLRPFLRLSVVFALAGAFALGGCGRKGPLDPPPAASLAGEQTAQKPSGPVPKVMDSQGRLITPPGPDKPLPIDALLN